MANITNPKALEIYEKFQNLFCNLYGRWQDEKEYEQPKEYEDHVTKQLALYQVNNVVMTKKPFGFKFFIGAEHFHIQVKARQYLMLQLKPARTSNYPKDLSKLTAEQKKEIITYLVGLSLPELRRRQNIVNHELKIANDRNLSEAITINLQIKQDFLMQAVDRKCFGTKETP